MRGLLAFAAVILVFGTASGREPGRTRRDVERQAEELVLQFRDLTSDLLRLTLRLEKAGQDEDAKLLRTALNFSEKEGMEGQFAQLLRGLKEEKGLQELRAARQRNEMVRRRVEDLLAILQTPDEGEVRQRVERELAALADSLRTALADGKAVVARLGDAKAEAAALSKEIGDLAARLRTTASASAEPQRERKAVGGIADGLAAVATGDLSGDRAAPRAALEKGLTSLADLAADNARRLLQIREELTVDVVAEVRHRADRQTELLDGASKRYADLRAAVKALPDGKPDRAAVRSALTLADELRAVAAEAEKMSRLLAAAPTGVSEPIRAGVKKLQEDATLAGKAIEQGAFAAADARALAGAVDRAKAVRTSLADQLREWGRAATGPRPAKLPEGGGALIASLIDLVKKQKSLGNDLDAVLAAELDAMKAPRLTPPAAVTLTPGEGRDLTVKLDWGLYPQDALTVTVAKSPATADLEVPTELKLTFEKHESAFTFRVTAGKTAGETTITLTPTAGKPVKVAVVVK